MIHIRSIRFSWSILCMATPPVTTKQLNMLLCAQVFFKFCFLIVSESGTPGSDLCVLTCCVNVLLLLLIPGVFIKSCLIKLGRMRGSLVTLQKLVHLFPSDTSFKNDLGVGYLLIGDNSNAKKVYEEVSFHSSQGKILFVFIFSF